MDSFDAWSRHFPIGISRKGFTICFIETHRFIAKPKHQLNRNVVTGRTRLPSSRCASPNAIMGNLYSFHAAKTPGFKRRYGKLLFPSSFPAAAPLKRCRSQCRGTVKRRLPLKYYNRWHPHYMLLSARFTAVCRTKPALLNDPAITAESAFPVTREQCIPRCSVVSSKENHLYLVWKSGILLMKNFNCTDFYQNNPVPNLYKILDPTVSKNLLVPKPSRAKYLIPESTAGFPSLWR